MLNNALNVKKIAALDKPGMYADGAGLYLRVAPSGSKSWVFVYQFEKRRREMGLGGVRDVALSVAREKAFQARQEVRAGRDPKAVAEDDRPTKTFGECATELVDRVEGGWRNAKHRQQWRNTLRTYGEPIWAKAVDTITTEDVLGILAPIWKTKEETASRVRGRIERVLDAAKALGHRSGENPARWKGNLKELLPSRTKKSLRGHHPAMPYDQVAAYIVELRKRRSISARALEFTILTAARTTEVLAAQWKEINGDIWIIPAERMKIPKPHRVPLTPAAIAVLKRQGLDDTNRKPEGYIFAGAKGRPLSNMSMEMLMRRMGVDEWTVHGFRSSFRDWAYEETEHAWEIAEAALAHAVGDETERAYRRGDALARRRRLMEDWAAFVMAAPAAA